MLTSELFALAPLQQEPPGSLGVLEVKEIAIKTAAKSCFFADNNLGCLKET